MIKMGCCLDLSAFTKTQKQHRKIIFLLIENLKKIGIGDALKYITRFMLLETSNLKYSYRKLRELQDKFPLEL